MNKATESELYKNIRPLADPVLGYRKFVGWIIVVGSVLSILLIVSGFIIGWDTMLPIYGIAFLLGGLPVLLFFRHLLPNRTTNALYLRSFSNDKTSWPMRKSIQEALGPKYRLSGIRDPRRRKSIMDYMGILVFLLRYATPKFMNLEAGLDWQQRLWRSLADAKCVFVDVTDLTPFVESEVLLSVKCVGLQRIMFVTESVDDLEELQTRIEHLLSDPEIQKQDLTFAVWNNQSKSAKKTFSENIKRFVGSLPKENPGINPKAFELTSLDVSMPEQQVHMSTIWYLLISQFAVGIVAGILAAAATLISPTFGKFVGNSTMTLIYAILGWYLIGFLIDTTFRKRITTMIWIAGFAVYLGLWALMIQAVELANEAAMRSLSDNKLRSQGLALSGHLEAHRSFPTTNYRPQGEVHNWQTHLLPYLGSFQYENLHSQIDFGSPWNAERNANAFCIEVSEYQSPGIDEIIDENGRAYSHYAGNSLVFNQPGISRFRDIGDGPGHTFFVGEVNDKFRAWGDPGNHRHPSVGTRGPGSFGRRNSDVALILMGDTSTRAISRDIDPEVFKALGTPNGSEKLPAEFEY